MNFCIYLSNLNLYLDRVSVELFLLILLLPVEFQDYSNKLFYSNWCESKSKLAAKGQELDLLKFQTKTNLCQLSL